MHWHGCRSVALLLLNGRVDIANDDSELWQGCENGREPKDSSFRLRTASLN